MKAAIYCRLSKEDEDLEKENRGKESESIQNQKSMLIDYALENGYEIYHIYSDEDYSGIDRNRPDFNRMIEAASQKKFDIILAKTQSRFTRDMELVENICMANLLNGESGLSQLWTMWTQLMNIIRKVDKLMG